jgi:hypothetical protein
MRRFLQLAIGFTVILSALTAAAQTPAKAPEVKSTVKPEYPLTSKCGPWMVMVKSFQGPEAVDYANRLARELREKHKITAYTFVKQPESSPVVQQTGFVQGRTRQFASAAVLAGDCKNEKTAAKLQEKIQKIRPSTITEDMVRPWQWRHPNDAENDVGRVLRTAFCLPNPLAPAAPQKPEPGLAKMNAGPNSLLLNPAEYTLEVALFTGGIAFTKSDAEKMQKTSLLEAAGEHAEQITAQLRQMGHDSYVYHGLTYSLVAVGSFSSPADPQIEQVAKQLAGMPVGLSFALSPSPRIIKVPER